MHTLKDILKDADKKGTAVGHFNFSDIAGFWAIFEAARELGVPVIFGVSEGERKFVGVRQAAALVRSVREEYDYPVFLNADHTYSLENVKEAIDAGYDAVIFDGAKLSFEENVKITKQCVEYAKAKDEHILVEGELGYIGSSSKLLEEVPEGARVTEDVLTTAEEASRFVKETGVHMLAPAVGELHGMLKHAAHPHLAIARIKEIKEAIGGIPLVLHGGSGITDKDFTAAIKEGITVVHLNTELRVAWRKGMEKGLKEYPDEIAPYKIFPPAVEAVKKTVQERLKLFSGL